MSWKKIAYLEFKDLTWLTLSLIYCWKGTTFYEMCVDRSGKLYDIWQIFSLEYYKNGNKNVLYIALLIRFPCLRTDVTKINDAFKEHFYFTRIYYNVTTFSLAWLAMMDTNASVVESRFITRLINLKLWRQPQSFVETYFISNAHTSPLAYFISHQLRSIEMSHKYYYLMDRN